MEDQIKVILLGGLFYFLFTWLINMILFYSVNIKLPFSKSYYHKKYGNKVNPIYKLERSEAYWSHYSVSKYELRWGKRDDRWWDFVFIGISVFQNYGYWKNDLWYGNFEHEQIEKEPLENIIHPYKTLKDYYENSKKIAEEKWQKGIEEDNRFDNKLNEINKEFNENYE